ncbi:MAG: PAAR domain-containing protein [Pseudomonadota bacterium]
MSPATASDTVTTGSANVTVGGKPVARSGDTVGGGQPSAATPAMTGASAVAPAAEGSGSVFINSKPALRVGDRDACGRIITSGASNVFVNGRPIALSGSSAADCE